MPWGISQWAWMTSYFPFKRNSFTHSANSKNGTCSARAFFSRIRATMAPG